MYDNEATLHIAMSRLCRIAYEQGLEALTQSEREILMCWFPFDITKVKRPEPKFVYLQH